MRATVGLGVKARSTTGMQGSAPRGGGLYYNNVNGHDFRSSVKRWGAERRIAYVCLAIRVMF
jgi:hypothetical protein